MSNQETQSSLMEAVAKVQAHYFRRIGNMHERERSVPSEEREIQQAFHEAKKILRDDHRQP